MKPIVRNLISVARRFKLATTLNIFGLSVAFAAFMVIMIQLDYDYGFDKFHKDSDKIFRMEISGMSLSKTSAQAVICRPFAERFFESSPHIVAGALSQTGAGNIFFHIENYGARNYFKEKIIAVTPEFTDVFTFDLVEGAADALKTPENIIIPQSLSHKLFGNESAVGKQLVSQEVTYTVGAVYRDLPANTVVNNYIYGPIPKDENKQNWNNWNYQVYFRINEAANISQLFENFKRNFDARSIWGESFEWDESGMSIRFTALPDIHYVTDVTYDNTPKASRQTLMILFVIAMVIIAIAAINFTNFSTALTPMRIKNINTQRVLGAKQSTLRLALLFEAIVISLLSYLIAVLFVSIFSNSLLAKLVNADLSLAAHPMIAGGTALVALLTGLFAGLYPSRYMTSFAPALVLKGSYGLSSKGRKLRNILISIQFVASFALIVGASFMYLQNYFMQNSSLGYDKDALVTVNIWQIQQSRDAFTNQIKAYSGIEDITYSESLLSSSDQYMGWARGYKNEPISFQCLPVHYTFLKVMGIEII